MNRILEIVKSSSQYDNSIKTIDDVKNTIIAGVENPHSPSYRKLEKIVLSHIGFREYIRLKAMGPKTKKANSLKEPENKDSNDALVSQGSQGGEDGDDYGTVPEFEKKYTYKAIHSPKKGAD